VRPPSAKEATVPVIDSRGAWTADVINWDDLLGNNIRTLLCLLPDRK
jgi:hypothetical protein